MNKSAPTQLEDPESPEARPAAEIATVHQEYGEGEAGVTALNDVTWNFMQGTFTAVMGPSGSGKTTLLQCLAGLLRPTRGEVRLGGVEINDLPETQLARIRREHVGFVFQEFNLVPALTAEENIELPLRLAGRHVDRQWLEEITSRTGVADRLSHLPHELSGGQQQRVAICRALVTRPAVVCADEPTGALDTTSGHEVMAMLRDAADTYQQTLVMVTHEPVVASYTDTVLFLVDGRIVTNLNRPAAHTIAETMTNLLED